MAALLLTACGDGTKKAEAIPTADMKTAEEQRAVARQIRQNSIRKGLMARRPGETDQAYKIRKGAEQYRAMREASLKRQAEAGREQKD